jgi:hypothetical protein
MLLPPSQRPYAAFAMLDGVLIDVCLLLIGIEHP